MDQTTEFTTLAQARPVTALPGLWRKQLTVPPQQWGLLIPPGQPPQALPTGQHTLGTWWQRFTGRFGQTVYLLLPQQPLTIPATNPRLRHQDRFVLSGDDELVDVGWQTRLRIKQPSLFYQQFIEDNGRITLFALQKALAAQTAPMLAPVVARYAAADLEAAPVQQALHTTLSQNLTPLLAQWGLELVAIDGLTVRPAATMAELAERVQAWESRLQEIAQSAKFDQLTQAAERAEYIRQLEADFDIPGFADLMAQAEAAAPSVPDRSAPTEPTPAWAARWQDGLRRWWQGRLAGAATPPASTADPAPAATDPKPTRPQAPSVPDNGGEPGWLRWFAFIRIGFSFLLIFLAFLDMAPSDPEYTDVALRLFIYGATLLVGIVSTIWVEERAWHNYRQRQMANPQLYLPYDERLRADHLLRRHVTAELDKISRSLKEIRLRHFQQKGGAGVAQIKGAEQRAEQMAQTLGQAQVGTAVYVALPKITAVRLAAAYEYDDWLRQQIQQVSDKVVALHTETVQPAPAVDISSSAAAIEADLIQFKHDFQGRNS